MSTARFTITAGIVLAVGISAAAQAPGRGGGRGGGAAGPAAPPLTLVVSGFSDGAAIPPPFTASAEKPVSPAMTWTNIPTGTQSFVIHLRDPDVTRNRTAEDQLHWLLWNIPGTSTGIPEGIAAGPELSDGTRQVSASGQMFRAPGAPATGPQHHYTFELFALDAKLDVPNSGDPFDVRKAVLNAMSGHVLGKAAYVGLFHRAP